MYYDKYYLPLPIKTKIKRNFIKNTFKNLNIKLTTKDGVFTVILVYLSRLLHFLSNYINIRQQLIIDCLEQTIIDGTNSN